jgi:hypothetical protein
MIPSIELTRMIFSCVIAGLFLMGLSFYAWKKFLLIYQRPWSFKSLLKGFKAKMWMTIGLGSFFFSFYLIMVLIGSYYFKQTVGQLLFYSAYQSPIYFIYFGLLIFACFSLIIYLVRMLIKYLFLTRGKGD